MRRRFAAFLLLATLTGTSAPAFGQDPEPAVTQDRIVFGEIPSVAVPLDGFMWVLDRRGATIGKIDPETNEVVDVIDLPELVEGTRSAWDLEAARGSLWLTIPSRRRIAEIDPAAQEVRSILRTRGFVSELDVARGSLWFTRSSAESTVLVRMDPRSGKRVATFRLGGPNTGVAGVVSFGRSVWVVRSRARHVRGRGRNATFYVIASLLGINPRSNRVTDKVPLGATYTRGAVNPVVGDVAAAADGLWMSRVHEKRLLLVNPTNAKVLDEEAVGEFTYPWEVEVLGDEVWTADLNRTRVVRIDPDDNERTFVDVGNATSYLATGFGSLWAPVTYSTERGGEVVRLTPQ